MWIYHRCLTMQEVNGLRNRYLDTYLPPRRKQSRAQNEPAREQITLQFLHYPITDLSIPTTEQCALSSFYPFLASVPVGNPPAGFQTHLFKTPDCAGHIHLYRDLSAADSSLNLLKHAPALSLPSPHAAALEISSMEALTKESLHCGRVQSITEDIRRRLEAGEKIYMHCWGGRGRAGTLGACLLGDLYGIGAEDALLRVQKAFDTRGDAGLPLSELE